MGIKGLTDRGMSFPEIGRIRKGKMVTKTRADGSSYQHPVDLDYFRVVFTEGEEQAAEKFREIYGEEPQEVNIMLPLTMGETWEAWLEAYTSGRLICRSDGEFIQYWYDPQKREVVVEDWLDKSGKKVPYEGSRRDEMVVGKTKSGKPIQMKPVGRLKVVIPELKQFAYLTFITGSYNDVENISSQLKSYYEIAKNISGVPLILKRRPREISTPVGNGDRARTEKWLVSVEARYDWVEQKMLEARAEEKLLGLVPGVDLKDDPDPDLIDAEFEDSEAESLDEIDLDAQEPIEIPGGVEAEEDMEVEAPRPEGGPTLPRGPENENDFNFLYDWAKERDDVSQNDINRLLKDNDMDALKAWTAFQNGGS